MTERGKLRTPRITAWAGVGTLALLTAASITGGIVALSERNSARSVAESRALAGYALAEFGSGELDRGLLLSLQAYSISPTVQARASLVQGLEDAGRVIRFLHVPSPAVASVTSLAFSGDSATLAVGVDGRVYRRDVASGRRVAKPLRRRARGPTRGRVAIDATGRLVATTGANRALRHSVGLFAAKLSASGTRLESAAVSPDGRVVAVGTIAGSVLRWDVPSGHALGPVLRGLVDPAAATTTLAFSPDGELLAAADSAGTVTVFDLAGSAFARVTPATRLGQAAAPHCLTAQGLPRKSDPVGCAYCAEPCADAVSPDGRLSAIAQQGEATGPDVSLWNTRTRQVLAHLRVANPAYNAVNGILFSPDGRSLAVAAGNVFAGRPAEETVTLFDAATGAQLGSPLVGPPHGNGVMRFAHDGDSLTLFGTDGTVTWRPLPLGRSVAAVRARICTLVGRNLTRAEWRQFIPDRAYQKTCPQWP